MVWLGQEAYFYRRRPHRALPPEAVTMVAERMVHAAPYAPCEVGGAVRAF